LSDYFEVSLLVEIGKRQKAVPMKQVSPPSMKKPHPLPLSLPRRGVSSLDGDRILRKSDAKFNPNSSISYTGSSESTSIS
jgi:hypothetical protein